MQNPQCDLIITYNIVNLHGPNKSPIITKDDLNLNPNYETIQLGNNWQLGSAKSNQLELRPTDQTSEYSKTQITELGVVTLRSSVIE